MKKFTSRGFVLIIMLGAIFFCTNTFALTPIEQEKIDTVIERIDSLSDEKLAKLHTLLLNGMYKFYALSKNRTIVDVYEKGWYLLQNSRLQEFGMYGLQVVQLDEHDLFMWRLKERESKTKDEICEMQDGFYEVDLEVSWPSGEAESNSVIKNGDELYYMINVYLGKTPEGFPEERYVFAYDCELNSSMELYQFENMNTDGSLTIKIKGVEGGLLIYEEGPYECYGCVGLEWYRILDLESGDITKVDIQQYENRDIILSHFREIDMNYIDFIGEMPQEGEIPTRDSLYGMVNGNLYLEQDTTGSLYLVYRVPMDEYGTLDLALEYRVEVDVVDKKILVE